MVICLERGADLHMAQPMPLPLTVSCFTKIPIGFTFLVPAHPGSPRQRAIKRVCVCVYIAPCATYVAKGRICAFSLPPALSPCHTLLERTMSTIERQCSRQAAFFHTQEGPMFSGLRSDSMALSHVWVGLSGGRLQSG